MKLDIYKYQSKKFNTLVSLFFEKIAQNNDHVMIFCNDDKKLQSIDKLLWEYNQSSWIPHLKTDDVFSNKAQLILSNDIKNNINLSTILCIIDSNISEIAEVIQFERIVYFTPIEKKEYTDSISLLISNINDCNIYNQQITGKWVKE